MNAENQRVIELLKAPPGLFYQLNQDPVETICLYSSNVPPAVFLKLIFCFQFGKKELSRLVDIYVDHQDLLQETTLHRAFGIGLMTTLSCSKNPSTRLLQRVASYIKTSGMRRVLSLLELTGDVDIYKRALNIYVSVHPRTSVGFIKRQILHMTGTMLRLVQPADYHPKIEEKMRWLCPLQDRFDAAKYLRQVDTKLPDFICQIPRLTLDDIETIDASFPDPVDEENEHIMNAVWSRFHQDEQRKARAAFRRVRNKKRYQRTK